MFLLSQEPLTFSSQLQSMYLKISFGFLEKKDSEAGD